MGNLFSKKEKTELVEPSIETVDSNNDGIITKEEFNTWVSNFQKELDNMKKDFVKQSDEKYNKIIAEKEREIIDYQQQIKDLEKQVEALSQMNITNINNMLSETEHIIKVNSDNTESELSKARINEMVDKLLADEDINIKYFPDWVEKALYRNVLTLVFGLLDTIMETTSVSFMGHKIVFDLKPQDNKIKEV